MRISIDESIIIQDLKSLLQKANCAHYYAIMFTKTCLLLMRVLFSNLSICHNVFNYYNKIFFWLLALCSSLSKCFQVICCRIVICRNESIISIWVLTSNGGYNQQWQQNIFAKQNSLCIMPFYFIWNCLTNVSLVNLLSLWKRLNRDQRYFK